MISNWQSKVARAWHRHVRRDPTLLAARRWKRDRGDDRLRLSYPLDRNSVVVDVGGYLGEFAALVVERFGCHVELFEPVPAFHTVCIQRFANEPRVRSHAYALGARDEVLTVGIEADATSVLGPTMVSGVRVAIQVREIDAAWAELGLDRVNLLKLNIEGAEYDVLDRLIDTGRVRHIQYLQVQFHDFVPRARQRRDQIRQRLASTHEEQWNYTFVWESWRRLEHVD